MGFLEIPKFGFCSFLKRLTKKPPQQKGKYISVKNSWKYKFNNCGRMHLKGDQAAQNVCNYARLKEFSFSEDITSLEVQK